MQGPEGKYLNILDLRKIWGEWSASYQRIPQYQFDRKVVSATLSVTELLLTNSYLKYFTEGPNCCLSYRKRLTFPSLWFSKNLGLHCDRCPFFFINTHRCSLVMITEELFRGNSGSGLENRNKRLWGTHCADHATPSIR
jgi:hypothetical protein